MPKPDGECDSKDEYPWNRRFVPPVQVYASYDS
jgi:hypothetical protein